MANILERYAESFRKNANVDVSAIRQTTDDKFSAYEESMKGKQSFSCRFEMADAEGNLSLIDVNGVKVVLLAETFQQSTPYYNKDIKDRFIGTLSLNVVVSKIDRENNIVFVESAVNKDEIKGSLIKAIFKALKKGEHPRLGGIVTTVSDKRLTVNILNKNIFGFLNASNWQPIYTRSLKNLGISRGDYIEFEVEAAAPKQKGLDYAFYLDRKNIVPDPWESLPDFELGTSIVVKCIERPRDKKYWWGVSKSVPGIEIICNYSDHVTVMTNCYYKCKIKKYDKTSHSMTCVPFEVVNVGIATEENILFSKNKRSDKAAKAEQSDK